jgi:hypothetical protein
MSSWFSSLKTPTLVIKMVMVAVLLVVVVVVVEAVVVQWLLLHTLWKVLRIGENEDSCDWPYTTKYFSKVSSTYIKITGKIGLSSVLIRKTKQR